MKTSVAFFNADVAADVVVVVEGVVVVDDDPDDVVDDEAPLPLPLPDDRRDVDGVEFDNLIDDEEEDEEDGLKFS